MRQTLAVLFVATTLVACARTPSIGKPASNSGTVPDTLVGVVTEVGSDPATWMSLRPLTGGQAVRLNGGGATQLRSLSHAEVLVTGARQADGFRVDGFEVRKANDVPVDDGIVSMANGRVFLTTRAGVKREIVNPPPQLSSMIGARIWISRPMPNQAPTWGAIQRP